MTQQELDYLHNQEKIPDWWYYQKSDKPIWMKWQEQTDKFNKEVEQRQAKKKEREEEQRQEEEIQKQVETMIEETINDLFKDFS